MKELSIKEEKAYYAGGLSTAAYALITAGISLLIGIFDGIARPFGCR